MRISTVFSRVEDAILKAGGKVVDPFDYFRSTPDIDAFEAAVGRYLKDSGVRHFKAHELLRPTHPDVAKRLGHEKGYLWPPMHMFPFAVLLLLWGDQARDISGRGATCRNWYRPMHYQSQPDPTNPSKPIAKSKMHSDHPHACGIDFDFKGNVGEVRAFWKRIWRDNEDLLETALGDYGGGTFHISVFSPRGHRSW